MPDGPFVPGIHPSSRGPNIVGDTAPPDENDKPDVLVRPKGSDDETWMALSFQREALKQSRRAVSATSVAEGFHMAGPADSLLKAFNGSSIERRLQPATSLGTPTPSDGSVALAQGKVPAQLLSALASLRNANSVRTSRGSVEVDYEILAELGRGAAGVVQLARHSKTELEVAIKTVALPQEPTQLQDLELELAIARRLKHPNIVRLDEVIKNSDGYHLVMELCTGGNLNNFITERRAVVGGYVITTALFCSYALQMLSAVAYLHHHRIVHRDIKPENYVMETGAPNSPLKLTDFGLACYFKKGEFMKGKCGSLYTMAPEVIQRRYTEKCDIWSVGVTAYVLGSGRSPFWGEDVPSVEQAIMKAKPTYGGVWCQIDDQAEKLVRQLLTADHTIRPSAKSALAEHRWLLKGAEEKEPTCCFFFSRRAWSDW